MFNAVQEVRSSLSYCPRSSLPAAVLAWLLDRLAHLRPARPPGVGGNPPLPLEVRLDAVAAVVLDGLSYRRAGRVVRISKTEVGESVDLLLGELAALGICQPDGTFMSGVRDVLDVTEVTALVDRGFRGMARDREHCHAPFGDRRTKDQLTQPQRDHNRLQAALRALVEQSIGHLSNAWALRRWRGLLDRVRDVDRAAATLISLGRWLHRVRA